MTKSQNDYFCDWESHVFGYGYGTGEEHVLRALKTFFANTTIDHDSDGPRGYSYETLEAALTPPVTWLLINTFCHADIIEYGTSPRYAWLTEQGERLKTFVDSKTIEELENICGPAPDYYTCSPHHCNCDDGPCDNPFWVSRRG